MAVFDAVELMLTNPVGAPNLDDFLKNAVVA